MKTISSEHQTLKIKPIIQITTSVVVVVNVVVTTAADIFTIVHSMFTNT